MKKSLSILLILTLLLSTLAFSSCKNNKNQGANASQNTANNNNINDSLLNDNNGSNVTTDDDKNEGNSDNNNSNDNNNDNNGLLPPDGNDDITILDTSESLSGMTPKEIYEFAKGSMKDALYFTSYSTQEITMTYEGESFTLYQFAISILSGDDCYIATANDMAPQAAIEAWYVDGMLYAITSEAKVKSRIDKEQFMQQYYGKDPGEDTILDLPESWFKDAKFEFDGECWLVRFLIDRNKYNELFGSLPGYENSDVEITTDVRYNLHFDSEGNLVKITNSVDLIIQGIPAHVDTTSEITMEVIDIPLPDDLDSFIYVEMQ